MVWGTGESLPYPYREIQRKERWEKIEDSRYSRYGKVKGKGGDIEIFKERLGGRQMAEVARFRLENEIRKRIYWEGEEKRACRLYEGKRETWEHV